MSDIQDTDTHFLCPIAMHSALRRWRDLGMARYRCKHCGEFLVATGIPERIAQYDDQMRARMSTVLAAVWDGGNGVAAWLDDDGLISLAHAATTFASTKDDHKAEKPIAALVEGLRAMFQTKSAG